MLRTLRHHRVHDDRRPTAADHLAGDALLRRRRPTIDVTTGIGYPKKADDAAPQPAGRAAVLRPDRVGTRARQSRSSSRAPREVDDGDLAANRERYLRESGEKLPATKEMHPPKFVRGPARLVLRPDLHQGAARAGVRLARRRSRRRARDPRRAPRGGPHRATSRSRPSARARATGGAVAWDERIEELGEPPPDGRPLLGRSRRLPARGRGCRSHSTAPPTGSGSSPSRRACRSPRAGPASPPTPTRPSSSGRRTSRCAGISVAPDEGDWALVPHKLVGGFELPTAG